MRAWISAGLLAALTAVAPGAAQAAESNASTSAASVVVLESPSAEATAFEVGGGLLTAAHAVDNGPVVAIVGGQRLRVTVARLDPARDLALLTGVTTPGGPLAVAERAPVPGEPVLAYGNGLGRGRIAVKAGIVSAVETDRGVEMLETDAAVNPGDSGGPLVAEDGSVIALITARQDGEGAAVAVTATELRDFLGSAAGPGPGDDRENTGTAPDPTVNTAGTDPTIPVTPNNESGGLTWWPFTVGAGVAVLIGVPTVWLRRSRRNRPAPRIVIELDPEPEPAGLHSNERL